MGKAILSYKLTFDSFGGKKYCLLVTEDSTDYKWRNFLKEKLNLKNVMMGLIKDLKTENNITVQNL